MSSSNTNYPDSSIGSPHRFLGWSWRGATLEPAEVAAYTPGMVLKHLGRGIANTGEPRNFPVIFWIYAWERCARLGDTEAVTFDPDTTFRVVRVDVLPGNRISIFLEQNASWSGGDCYLEGEYESRKRAILPTPPPADPDMIEAFKAPFARWTEDAKPGDAPLRGVLYEFEEAVRFASAWTGVDPDQVRQILEAKSRYLELAGISGCEEDDDLIRERAAVRHLLPETPDFIDDRETQYLALVTGLDEETILRIGQGETAYMESLGLITWNSEEEREEGLGSPEDADDGDAWEGDEWEGSLCMEGPPMREGHDHHWKSVLPDPEPYLTQQLAQRPGIEHLRLHVPSPDPRWEGVSLYAIPSGPNLETGLMFGEGQEGAEPISAFPIIRDGAAFPLDLHGPRVWENQCEAVTFASGMLTSPVPFFDLGHLHPWNGEVEWGSEAPTEVHLAGFAYQMDPIGTEEPCEQSDPFGLTPRPWREAHPDDHLFKAALRSVTHLTAWGHPFYRLELDLAPEDGQSSLPLLPVYVAAANLAQDWEPRIGETVRGMLWLQGSAVPLGTPVISSGDE